MHIETIPNPTRRCGRLREGGYYLQSEVFAGGTLAAWTWVLGRHVVGERPTLYVDVPPRAAVLFNPLATLSTGFQIMDTSFEVEEAPAHLQHVGYLGVLDHVGSRYYTPWTFAEECRLLGPSRRVPESLMRRIAPLLPLPVFFAHADVPVFESFPRAQHFLLEFACVGLDEVTFNPTWENPTWGLRRGDVRGEDHFVVSVLRTLDGARQNGTLRGLSDTLRPEVYQIIFGVSWFTRGVYVLRDGEDDLFDPSLGRAGVVPVRVES